jgi:hypothetical protein
VSECPRANTGAAAKARGPISCAFAASWAVASLLVAFATPAAASSVTVQNGSQLASAIAGAQAGDTITLLDGTYDLPAAVVANAAGTAGAPIKLVSALQLHGATIVAAGGAEEAILVQSPYWSFDGVDFSGGTYGLRFVGNGANASVTNALFTDQSVAAVRADCGGAAGDAHCDNGRLDAIEITRSASATGCIWAGIEIVGAQGWSVHGVSVHDVVFDQLSCAALNSVYGIAVRGNSSGISVDSVAIAGAAIGIALGPPSQACEVRGSVKTGTSCSIPTTCEASSSQVSNALVYDSVFEGVLLANACAVGLHNATLWNNGSISARSVETSSAGTPDISNVIFNVAPTLGSGVTTSGSGNLTLPATADTTWFIDAAGGNFRLLAGAPAVDTGVTLASVPLDFDGIVRPQGSAYDVGAFERPTGGYPDGGFPLLDGGIDGGSETGGGGGPTGSTGTIGGGQTQPQKTNGCNIGFAGSSGAGAIGLSLALLLALVVRKRVRG